MADEKDPNDTPAPIGWATNEPVDGKSLWTRFRDALTGGANEAAPEPAPAEQVPLPMAQAPVETPSEPERAQAPSPRKAQKTAFDEVDEKKKPESRRTRLRRFAQERREGLALVVGEKVEKVLVEKMETKADESLSKVASGFVNLNEVLNGLGRTLTTQEEAARALNEGLAKLPGVAEVQADALRDLAKGVKEQAGTTSKVAMALEGVPDIVSLVRVGTGNAQGQLATLREVRQELELQRDQRERVIEGVRGLERAMSLVADRLQACFDRQTEAQQESASSASRLERALSQLGQKMDQGAEAEDARSREEKARSQEANARLERALQSVATRIESQTRGDEDRAREERVRAQDEAERFERGFATVAARVHEQQAAILESHEDSAECYRESQRAILEGFEDVQAKTVAALERFHEERAKEQAKAQRRSRLFAGVGALVLVAAIMGLGAYALDADRSRTDAELDASYARSQAALEAVRARAAAKPVSVDAVAPATTSTTLPAGMPR